MPRKVSRKVWIWNVPGVFAVGKTEKDSRGETASEVAEREPSFAQARYLAETISKEIEGKWGFGDEPSVMSLEAKVFRARDAVHDPDLPDVMRLCRRRVSVDDVLKSKRKDVSIGVAGQCRRRFCREDDDNRSGEVCHCISRDPRVVVVGIHGLSGRIGADDFPPGSRSFPRRASVFGSDALPLLGLLVAFEA